NNAFYYGVNPLQWIDPLGTRRKKPQADAPTHPSRTDVQKINGRRPINHCFAGKTMTGKDLPENIRGKYPHGVPFDMHGFPDFSRYAKANVNIGGLTSDSVDFRKANEAAFGKGNAFGSKPPPGMTWHHHQESGKMQLIPEDIHNAVKHTGGAACEGTRR
ncbi:MAG: HNH endonuclease, partial [Casimicrobium sp.]